MSHVESAVAENHHHSHEEEVYSRTIFGFWLYLLTDFVLFATLFAAYAVLHNNTFGGPDAKSLFSLPFTLTQSLILLVSSLTMGIAGTFVHKNRTKAALWFMAITFVLGFVFAWMGCADFSRLVDMGASWKRSAFLSMYFTVVGTHMIHIFFGLLWIILLAIPLFKDGIKPISLKRITCLRMFWQFVNVIWIFIFSIIYLMGVN